MSNNIRAWCASHIDTKHKPILINMMIESLLVNSIMRCDISISFNQKYNREEKNYMMNGINNFVRKLKIRFPDAKLYTYYNFDKEMSQFEHLNYLYRNFMGTADDKIMFIDDDDILLRLPDEYLTHNIVQGYQYLPISTKDYDGTYEKNLEQIQETAKEFSDLWRKDLDFSGYMCRYHDLVEYFTVTRIQRIKDFHLKVTDEVNLKQLLVAHRSLEDTEFMNYLDSKKAQRPEIPFIFRRLWQADDRDRQTWLSNLNKVNILESEIV